MRALGIGLGCGLGCGFGSEVGVEAVRRRAVLGAVLTSRAVRARWRESDMRLA